MVRNASLVQNIYTRRQLIERGLIGLSGLSLSGLAGCTTSSPTSPTSGIARLHMLFWGSTTRNTLTRQVIDLFQKRYPKSVIDSQYTGSDTYWNTLNALISAGNSPDFIQMDMRYVSQYVRKGMLLDLTQFIYDQTIDLSDYDPLLLDSSKVNNTIYGIPMGENYQCMLYDTALLNQAGMGAVPENMDWKKFADYTSALSMELTKAAGENLYGTSNNSGDITTFEIWLRQQGKELYTYDGKWNFPLADVVEWYGYWSDLSDAQGCLPMYLQVNFDNTNTPFDSSMIKGKAVFNVSYSNIYTAYQAATPHALNLIMPPGGPATGIYLKASMLLSIGAQTAYPTVAANFINFINNDADAVKVLGFERGIPGSARARDLLNPHLTLTQQNMTTYVDFVSRHGNTRVKEVLDPPGAGQVAALLKQIAQKIGMRQMSVTEGASTFYSAAQQALKL